MNVLDLFSGIGGFALGLQRAGFTTTYFCEIDPYCRRVLAQHWPDVPCFEDVRALHGADLGPVDLICGGFPCQDISLAGKGAGLSGARSGLWSEYARLIQEVKPKYVLIENVAALRSRGLDQVLGEIAALGYDAEWHCIPASAVGAPHRRDRVWIVAYARSEQHQSDRDEVQRATPAGLPETAMADTQSKRTQGGIFQPRGSSQLREDGFPQSLAYPFLQQRHRWSDGVGWWEREPQETVRALRERRREEDGLSIPESLLGRVAYGIPSRVDRLKGLGNAIVPQIAEVLGRAILAHAESVRVKEAV